MNFSVNIGCNPKILKMVIDDTILDARTTFSPGVHQHSHIFHRIWAHKFEYLLNFAKRVPFRCIPKINERFSMNLYLCHIFLLSGKWHWPSSRIKVLDGIRKKLSFFLKNTNFWLKIQYVRYVEQKFRMNARGKYLR